MKRIKILLAFILLLLLFSGCFNTGSKPVTEIKEDEKQQTANDFIRELNDMINEGNYDKFNRLLSLSGTKKFTQEDFNKLKSSADESDHSFYFILPGKDNKKLAFKVYKTDNSYSINKVTIIPEEISYYIREAVEPEDLELSEPTKAKISSLITNMGYIYSIKWSPDNTSVAFVRGDTISLYGQMYLWKVGESKPKAIESVNSRICDFFWCPNSEYVIADAGTYVTRSGFIVSIRDSKLIKEIGYMGKICWSPDHKMFAACKVSDVSPAAEYDIDNISDLVLYNVEAGEAKIIDKATPDSTLQIKEWKENNIITYKREYLSKGSSAKDFEYKYK